MYNCILFKYFILLYVCVFTLESSSYLFENCRNIINKFYHNLYIIGDPIDIQELKIWKSHCIQSSIVIWLYYSRQNL